LTALDVDWQDLRARYFDGSDAWLGAELLEQRPAAVVRRVGAALARTARLAASHKRLELIDAVDAVLDYYGVVELAIQSGFVGEPLPSEAVRVFSHLRDPRVFAYYLDSNPRLLPVLLLARVEGKRSIDARVDAKRLSMFLQFLDIRMLVEERVGEPRPVHTFLQIANGRQINGVRLKDVFARLDLGPDSQADGAAPTNEALEGALDGLQRFIEFSTQLDALVASGSTDPLFQAAMWHFYAPWFGPRGEVLQQAVQGCLGRIENWSRREHADNETKSIVQTIERVRHTMAQLSSAGYGRALDTVSAVFRRSIGAPRNTQARAALVKPSARRAREPVLATAGSSAGRATTGGRAASASTSKAAAPSNGNGRRTRGRSTAEAPVRAVATTGSGRPAKCVFR
jgi:hypothetical protein